MVRRIRAAMWAASAGAALGALAAGCAANRAPEGAPDWYVESLAETGATYPELSDIPERSGTLADPAHLDEVAADLLAAAAEMRAHPRAEPAPGTAAADSDAFADQARRDIEATRNQH